MMIDNALLLAAFAAAGLFAGFIGGLFGVGGGIVIVPVLFHLLGVFGVDPSVRMHVAVGTSLSTIVVTSWRSMSTHAKTGAVDFEVLKSWGPWIALGAVLGAGLAGVIETDGLVIIFGVGLLLVAANMGLGKETWRIAEDLPTGFARAAIAGAIGVLSALMGVGGGSFGVTVMTLCGRPIHQAVATASGFGAAIAIPATIGFMITGWGNPSVPPGSVGYVNLVGFALLAVLTAITAPYGARAAHRLDRVLLKRLFAVFMAITALNLLREGLLK
ncbi:MAG: sulfite exporter TauE/SafE family protein [Caulobacterales bacterium]